MYKIMLAHFGALIGVKGGQEKVFCNMANEFTQRGYDVLAVGFDTRKKGIPAFPLDTGVKFINIGENAINKLTFWDRLRISCAFSKDLRHRLRNRKLDTLVINKLDKLISTESPDVIVSFNPQTTRIIKKSKYIDIPVISMLHIHPEACFEKLDSETATYFSKSDCIQVLLPSFRQVMSNYVKHNNIVSIGNVVSKTSITCNYKSKVIINVARLSKEKRLDLLIKAFAKCKEQYKYWKIEFWGEESTKGYFDYCQSLVKKYSLQDNIHFCGTTDNIYEKLSQASIFAFPSAFEGFSLALTEAMSVGLPCIGFKSSPSVNELIIDGQNGILCDDGVDALADALKELMDDEEKRRRYGTEAKLIMQKYAPKTIWDEWENLIKDTVANK